MNKGKIILCGCHETGLNLAEMLLNYGIIIDYFVCISPEKAAEQKVSGYEDFGTIARKFHIPIYYAEKYSLKSIKDQKFFFEHKFDLLIQGGWQRLFPNEILSTLRIGAIGLHGSADYLPFGRGRSPINWSLIENRSRFIFQYFIMKPGIDDGDVFHAQSVDINSWDDCYTLYLKNSILTFEVLKNYIPLLLIGDYTISKQDGDPTYYVKRTAEMAQICWENDILEVYNFIRAQTKPYPGAFSICENEKIMIWKAQPFDTRIDLAGTLTGSIVFVDQRSNFVVKVIGGLILVTEYDTRFKPEVGKRFI